MQLQNKCNGDVRSSYWRALYGIGSCRVLGWIHYPPSRSKQFFFSILFLMNSTFSYFFFNFVSNFFQFCFQWIPLFRFRNRGRAPTIWTFSSTFWSMFWHSFSPVLCFGRSLRFISWSIVCGAAGIRAQKFAVDRVLKLTRKRKKRIRKKENFFLHSFHFIKFRLYAVDFIIKIYQNDARMIFFLLKIVIFSNF